MSSSDRWEWPGARWWKCDLHLHTPHSRDFADQGVTAEQWVDAALAAGLDAVAVTDHNGADWVEEVQAAIRAKGAPLVAFPGVELTVQGGHHLLLLFDPENGKARDSIVGFLAACGIQPDHFGNPQAIASVAALTALEEAEKKGALSIAPHLEAEKGIGRIERGQTLQGLLTSPRLHGAELKARTPESAELEKFLSGGVKGYERVGGPLAVLTNSDAHSLAQIGQRSTWIKMTRPSLAGLRLALLDGMLSVQNDLDGGPADPNQHAELAIESMQVTEAHYLGNKEPFEVRFNPWLNALIGGRGTGKSTLVEFLRLALHRGDEVPDELREDLEKYKRAGASRTEEGLIRDKTRIQVVYRKQETRYRLTWKADGPATIEEKEPGSIEWTTAPGRITERFPIRIFSQKQLFQLARDPRALRHVLDQAPEVAFSTWQAESERLQDDYVALVARWRQVHKAVAEKDRLAGQVQDLQRKLEVFERPGSSELRQQYHLRQRQATANEEWFGDLERQLQELGESTAQLQPVDFDPELLAPEDEATRVLGESLNRARGEIERARTEIQQQVNAALRHLQAARQTMVQSAFASAHREAVAAYEAFERELAAQQVASPGALSSLAQERAALQKRLRELEGQQPELARLEEAAEGTLQATFEHRTRLTAQRRAFLDEILGNTRAVKASVVPFGDKEVIAAEIQTLLGIPEKSFHLDLESLVEELYSSEVSDDLETRLRRVKTRWLNWARGKTADAAPAHGRLLAALQKCTEEQLDRFQLWYPEDLIELEYSPSSQKKSYQPIRAGSPGQKSAALLALFLSYGDEPLVLDQPEDDLDNQVIYEVVVQRLREIKRHRQVLMVTHNPNLVVNGDAELVVALEVANGQTHKAVAGGLQEQAVRDKVCQVMEGGAEAFRRRYQRLGEPDVR